MEKKEFLTLVKVIGSSIRELGEVPSGHLYAAVATHNIDIDSYDDALTLLISMKLISRSRSHVLKYIA